MVFHHYFCYGLSIGSELPCPEFPIARPNLRPDVQIKVLSLAPVLAAEENPYFNIDNEIFRLNIPGVATYLVQGGSHIEIQPHPEASFDKIRLFLLGSAFGALLYQRGLFPLHGSAVATVQGAMLFLGAQGAGKSTLAAHFHRKGYRLLSDDVCAVTSRPDGFQVVPAFPQLRLCPDALERLGSPAGARFEVDKFVLPLGPAYHSEPMPLRAIHILETQEEPEPRFEPVQGFDRVRLLLENLYRPQFLQGQASQGALMTLAAGIAAKVPLVRVLRRRDAAHIDDLVGALIKEWSNRYPQSS